MEDIEAMGIDLSRSRRGTPKKPEILYKFQVQDERIPFEDVLEILDTAKTALNGIYGEAAMLLETRVYRLYQERIVLIDGNTFLGQCLAKAYFALLNKAYCRLFVITERVDKDETLPGLNRN